MFYGTAVLENLAKFTGKHMCQSVFFYKVEGSLLKWDLAQVFPVNFFKSLFNLI